MDRKKIKTLGLLSGGLDSTIAVKLMAKLGFDITVLNFMSPFCTCTKKSNGCKSAAHQLAGEMELEIKTIFMGDEYIDMLRAPKYGYGKHLNPCIDCRIMMFRQAGRVMAEIGARFIFTGEVIGQRPMSQMKNRLNKIENESGLKGLIVRPLSAALLPPTIPEIEGLINREEMLAISGRSRKPQMELGRELGVPEENLCSSGGCLLTDRHFAARMKDLIDYTKNPTIKETRMLRIGRHFRVSDGSKVIVGRNEMENEKIAKMAPTGSTLIRVLDYGSPCVLVIGKGENGCLDMAGRIAARYSDAPKNSEVEVEITTAGSDETKTVKVFSLDDEKLSEIRV
ncbi:MAG: hypothetical protein IEMM0002_1333 [bacterium]|nr:MAG: hypothetical protein IEMM0002_1333 [bacterium]